MVRGLHGGNPVESWRTMSVRTRPLLSLLSAAAMIALPACQGTGSKGGSGEDFVFDDYPFDAQGNYIERSAAGMRGSGGRKPVSAASNVPPLPAPDPGYEVVDLPPVAAAPPRTPSSRPAASGSGSSGSRPASRPAPAPTRSYTVKSGDTLWAISRQHKTTVKAIKDANGLKSDLIRVGQTLRIPR